jgi:hypothetical protein
MQDHIWDELALARDLSVTRLEDDGDGTSNYRVALTVKMSPELNAILINLAAKYRHTPEKRLRDFVKLGLKVCFTDADQRVAA